MKRAQTLWILFVVGCSSSASSVGQPDLGPVAPAPMPSMDPGNPYASGVPTSSDPDPTPSTAPVCDQNSFTGAAIDIAPSNWMWVPFADAKCRDGSATGLGIRLQPGSNRLVIYLEGGGACFHGESCATNDVIPNFSGNAFGTWVTATGNAGIFDMSRDDNPFKGWNQVYVPYCTGDVHAGAAEHVDVPGGPSDQMFVGYKNIGLYLQRLVPTLPHAEHVVVTGISAGGVGAAFNYDRVAQAFCHSRVTLLDDSGPVMTDDYLKPCLQERWRQLWNLDATLPADCAACRGPDGGGMVNYLPYLTNKYPNENLGIVSANQDGVISLFFGYGENNCQGLSGASAGMSGSTFEAGLMQVRSMFILPTTNWGSYLINSSSHTWITALTFYNTSVGGVPLNQWVDQLVNQHSVSHIAP